MNKIYLDNASTTPIRPEVIQEMANVMQTEFGNPSSTHSFGRGAKVILETARKSIAKQLQEKGFDVKAILSPTVPEGQERLGFCLHSFNSKDEITQVLEMLINLEK